MPSREPSFSPAFSLPLGMGLSLVLITAAAVVAIVDWYAVGSARCALEIVAKPATMALLVGVAATVGDAAGPVCWWLVIGALLGLVGDIALLGDGDTSFMVGLGAFALGHLGYAVAAVNVGFDPLWAVPGLVCMAALVGYRFASQIVPGAAADGGRVLGGAVVFYGAVISAMVVTAWATTAAVAAVGAVLFAVSDWVLGHQRFVGPLPGGRLSVIVPYHLGQALLILGLAAASP